MGGMHISSLYSSSQTFNGSPEIYSNQNLILLQPEQFLQAKRIFYKNHIFNMNQIISFLSNKYGGIHFDRDREKYKDWQINIK